jgi:hypothetical protein
MNKLLRKKRIFKKKNIKAPQSLISKGNKNNINNENDGNTNTRIQRQSSLKRRISK